MVIPAYNKKELIHLSMNPFDMSLLAQRTRSCQQRIIQRKIAPGNALIIGNSDTVLLEQYEGLARTQPAYPMGPKTLFRMFSMTKVVTVIAALQLWEQGKLRLDTPISDYLPAYANLKVWENGSIRNAAEHMTIRHLFTMTSGLSYLAEDMNGLQEAFLEKWRSAAQSPAPWNTIRVAEELASLPLCFDPGERFLYGFSHDVLGAIIEIISGKNLEAYCTEHIFQPLGMTDSSWHLDKKNEDRLALCYGWDGAFTAQSGIGVPSIDLMEMRNPSFFSGGAGLICTAADYAKFCMALLRSGELNSQRILGRKTVELLTTPALNHQQRSAYCNPSEDPSTFGPCYSYGLGVRVLTDLPATTIGSIGEWGWSGAMGTWMSIDPAEGFWFIYAHQHAPAEHRRFLPDILSAIYSSLK